MYVVTEEESTCWLIVDGVIASHLFFPVIGIHAVLHCTVMYGLVELHHDRCDITANLVLSKSQTYEGGGTFIPDVGSVVKLEQGEFLLHPGSLVHGGMDIQKGTRYLLVIFAHLEMARMKT
jgi:predicted 2-oxoglutarate/Fe(II)-dependent dioxygenase YbiX